MPFEPRVYNLSILIVRPIPLHSFNRTWRTIGLADRGLGGPWDVSRSHCRIAASLRQASFAPMFDSPFAPPSALRRLDESAYPEENVVVAIDDGRRS
jgi:hypothetical protein